MAETLDSLKSSSWDTIKASKDNTSDILKQIEGTRKKAISSATSSADKYTKEANAYRDSFMGNVSSAYDAKRSSYDTMGQGLTQNFGLGQNLLTQQADASRTAINDNTKQGMDDISVLEDKTYKEHKKSLQSLSEEMRNAFQAGNTYLGKSSAFDSSATPMYNTALQQTANKSTASLEDTLQNNLGGLKMEKTKLTREANAKLAEVDTWLGQNLGQLQIQYNSQMAEIQAAKAEATGEEYLQLAEMERELMNRAQTMADQFLGQAMTWQTNIDSELSALDNEIEKLTSNLTLQQKAYFESLQGQLGGGGGSVPSQTQTPISDQTPESLGYTPRSEWPPLPGGTGGPGTQALMNPRVPSVRDLVMNYRPGGAVGGGGGGAS